MSDGFASGLVSPFTAIRDLTMTATSSAESAALSTLDPGHARESDSLHQAILRSQAVIEFDLQGHVLTANALFLRTMGYSLAEVQGKSHRIFCPPAQGHEYDYQAFWDSLRAGQAQAGEFLRLNRLGEPVWLQATYTPILGEDGSLVKIVKFASDITASRIKALDADGKLNAINRAQAVIEFDLQGHVLAANANFLDLFGYQIDEIKGRHHRCFVGSPDSSSGEYQAFWGRLARGEFESGEYKRVGKDGREIWIRATYNPIVDDRGSVRHGDASGIEESGEPVDEVGHHVAGHPAVDRRRRVPVGDAGDDVGETGCDLAVPVGGVEFGQGHGSTARRPRAACRWRRTRR